MSYPDCNPSEPVKLVIDGTLDLHAFSPKDIKYLIPDYLKECQKAGIYSVCIIHGKGQGALRRSVQAILARLDCVATFHLDVQDAGNWGATLVTLRQGKHSGGEEIK